MVGTTVGKYRIVGQLGRGATGVVYRAVDETLDREVAIKVLNPDLADTDVIKRFRAEATTLARLNHPEIATIYELLRTDHDLLMVMELVRGETLEKLSHRLGPLGADRAAYLVNLILSALEHAHRAGVVHRDMKPANVMVTALGGVKVMDFGIARVRGAEHMTRDGFAIGTPAYMAPEQVLGEKVDGRADIYSVGVIFYGLLTGALPFDAETPMGMLQKHVADPPTPLHAHRPDLPAWCEAAVQRALAKAPDDRFQSAEEFRAALAEATGTGASIDLAKAFAVATTESAPSAEAPRVWQTVAISPTDVASGATDATTDEGLPAAQQSRETTVPSHAAAILHAAKQFGRRWEAALLMAVAVLAMIGYSALGGAGIAPIVADAPPPATFPATALLGSGNSQRERDVTLLLADGQITVTPNDTPGRPLHTVPYERVLSVTYSRGRDPMWKSAKGAAPVVRSRGGTLGKFGIFVARHWIVLQTDTDTEFVVLRVEEAQARAILTAIAGRSGRTPESIVGR
jgi:serine/threonine-protein kinase